MHPAGHPFTREYLTSLKRADIQKLCKDYGVRANMKTEALIELLLDSFRSNMSPLVGPSRQQQQPPAPRRVSTRSSTRVSSLRSRGTSGSSSSTSLVASSTSNTVPVASPRASKSKLTQYKLGVGRPSAPAVSNLRNTSRSSSSSKASRGRLSRSYRPPHATIAEEPETSQSGHVETQNTDPNQSRVSSSATDNNDVVTRLGRLESTFREADVKHQLESLRSLPSQVAYIRASVQQREAEIMGLRGELNVCKTEILTLRSEVSKISILEDQLKAMKDSLEQLKASSSNSLAKGKSMRRVPTPFADSNMNLSSSKTTPAVHTPTTIMTMQGSENPIPRAKSPSAPSEVALGKRPSEAVVEAVESYPIRHEENPRPIVHERKRVRTGAERRPLQEKVIELKREPEKPTAVQEGGEAGAGSAGSSDSGPSSQTQTAVNTPPPPAANAAPDYVGEVSTAHSEVRSEDLSMIDFCHAASSTPRDDMFNFFDDGEEFSQLSVTKLAARLAGAAPPATTTTTTETNGPTPTQAPTTSSDHQPQHHIQQEPRRISSTVARPRTPPRPSGPGRFRVPVESSGLSPVHEDFGSPFDPYSDGMFTIPFGAGLNTTPAYGRRELQHRNQNQTIVPAPMPLALGYGLATTTATGMVSDDSPVRQIPQTMFGTELNTDTRFGDFGRDGVASSSTLGFW